MSSRLKISLALSVGVCGLILAGANLPVDTQLTIRTKLGKRTQPHWIVPADSKVVKTEGGSGLIRLFGGLVGCLGFGTAMHLAGTDEREQTLFWQKKNVFSGIDLKEHEASAEIYAGARLKKLQMEAQADVDYHSLQLQQKFRDAIGFRPVVQQPVLPHGKPGTLDDITTPGDKVENVETVIAIDPTPNKYAYINGFLSSTCLAWGNQGSGKSWFVRHLVREKIKLGYRVIVFDPNSNQASWEGVELYNSYAEIERMMRWYVNEVQERYEEFCASTIKEEDWRAELWKQGLAVSIICEEATTYADFIEDSELLATFFRCGGTLSRKPEMPLTIVAHNNTQYCLGNVKGLANLIRRMQQIQLLATTDKSRPGSQPIASGRALVKIDGSDEWVEVEIPKIESKITNFRPYQKQQNSTINKASNVQIDKPSSTDTTPTAPDSADPALSPAPLLDKVFSNSHQSHHPIPQGWKIAHPADITPLVRGVIVACIRAGWGQTKTIQEVFGITKSGNNFNYDLAREVFQQIANSIN